ncbi:hypothetical protein KDA11_02545 [Candidatus Saccharibacteria bacterium]|nr:hypothetical protein [Candidatus Saccharibacteria bacterium]
MKFFGRRKNQIIDPTLSPELQNYTKSERRERLGIVWLVGIMSLVISLILMAILFFGGRWIYRKMSRANDSSTVQVNTDEESKNDTDTKTSDKIRESNESRLDDPTANDNQTDNQSADASTSTITQPITGDQSTDTSNLPNTGPEFDL